MILSRDRWCGFLFQFFNKDNFNYLRFKILNVPVIRITKEKQKECGIGAYYRCSIAYEAYKKLHKDNICKEECGSVFIKSRDIFLRAGKFFTSKIIYSLLKQRIK